MCLKKFCSKKISLKKNYLTNLVKKLRLTKQFEFQKNLMKKILVLRNEAKKI